MKAWRRVVCAICVLAVLSGGKVAMASEGVPSTGDSVEETEAVAVETSTQNASTLSSTMADESSGNDSTEVLPVEVVALDDADLNLGMLYGARVVIPEGTRYYASADGRGSGPYGVMGGRYAPMGADYYIGGFSNMDENDHPEKWRAYNPGDVPVAEDWSGKTEAAWDDIWVVIFRDLEDDYPLGWLPARSVVVVNGILGDGGSNAEYQSGVVVVEKTSDDGSGEKPSDVDPSLKPSDVDPGLVGDTDSTPVNEIDPGLASEILRDPSMISPEVIDKLLPDPGNALEDRIIKEQDERNADDSADSLNTEAFISTREIAYAIEDYADNGEKVALLLDASGSVANYMADISSYGEYIDKVNKADIIVAFARNYAVISAEEYLTAPVNTGRTNIYAALNNLEDVSSYDRVIVVTDTYHNVFLAWMNRITGFDGKIVMVCPNELSKIDTGVVRNIEHAFGTTVYLCKLNNQLDQIQVLDALSEVQIQVSTAQAPNRDRH